MFATDRDLLVYEPRLFLEVAWLGQRLLRATGPISSGGATLLGQNLAEAGVGVGSVASFGEASYEVISLPTSNRMELSRVRAATGDPQVPPVDVASTLIEVVTFRPQMGVVHGQILRMLGLEPEDPGASALTESAVVNPGALTRLESLGTLHLVFSAAAASSASVSVGGSWAVQRSVMYRERFAAERARVSVLIDTTGDGEPDATRRPGVGHLVRG